MIAKGPANDYKEVELRTRRLHIVALSPKGLRALAFGPVGTSLDDEWLDDDSRMAMKMLCEAQSVDPQNAIWRTCWRIVSTHDKKSIGGACFMGPPDDQGRIVVGYGLGCDYWGRGFMSEALLALCDWALAQKGVRSIIAETSLDNVASHGALQKCGFIQYREEDESLFWSLSGRR